MKIYLLTFFILFSSLALAENQNKKPSKKVKNKKSATLPEVKKVEEAKMEYYDGDPLAPLKIHKDKMKELQKKQKK